MNEEKEVNPLPLFSQDENLFETDLLDDFVNLSESPISLNSISLI